MEEEMAGGIHLCGHQFDLVLKRNEGCGVTCGII
jgi:hypothetical protein